MSQDNVVKAQFPVFDASNYKIGIVVAQFNRDITDALLSSALKKAKEYKISDNNIIIKKVAGSVEAPVVLSAMAKSKKFDCLLVIGTIIRGQTVHFDYVAKIVSEGMLRVMLDYNIAIGFCVPMCENHDQAVARIHTGAEALEAAIQTAKTIKSI
jgi:6,7-dimethyl-8-ribityllumazine synthase